MPVIDGLITGIDTTSIIESLTQVRKQRIDLLTVQQNEVKTQQSAFKQIESQVIALRSQASSLGRSQNNVFDGRILTTSDEDALAGTASSKASPGTFQVRVMSLAQAHQVASQGFVDADAEISTGTFQIQAGAGTQTTITIDSSNNTLQGLADAINGARAGVSASIVQDSTNPSAPARLLLTAEKTGTSNAIAITNNLAASSGTAVRPEIDFGNPVQAAADATVQLGTGPGAITATSASNTIDSLISGVTLNVKEANPLKTLTVTVARNTENSVTAVQSFVDAYNDLMDLFAEQMRYTPETETAGVLLGNRSASELQAQVRNAVLGVIPGVNSKANRLSAIGVTVTDTGHLTFNSSKLKDVIEGRVAGVAADDVRRLFAMDGQSTNGGVSFVIGSSRTGAPSSPIQVDITQAAERAVVTAGTALAASTVIDGTNDTLAVTLDGAAATDVKIAHGTYTAEQLAAALETALNSNQALTGRQASVGLLSGALSIQSDSYGGSSEVTITGGTALAALGLTGNETDTGLDVAGSFIVDGVTETATGRGRLLVGADDNANTADLQLRVSLSASQVQAGVDAEVTVTRGVASKLDQVLGKILDPVSGRIKTVNDGFDDKIEALQKAIDRQNEFFEKQQQELIDQFTALETTIAQLQSTATYLSSQLTSVNQSKS